MRCRRVPVHASVTSYELHAIKGDVVGDAPSSADTTDGDSQAELILVVEDNPITRKTFGVVLGSAGYTVLEAGDAATALACIAKHRPAMVLQDLVLPDMDGIELLRRLRAHPHARDIPILGVSGFLARMNEATATNSGFTALVLKPIEPTQLLEIVRLHLDRAQANSGAKT